MTNSITSFDPVKRNTRFSRKQETSQGLDPPKAAEQPMSSNKEHMMSVGGGLEGSVIDDAAEPGPDGAFAAIGAKSGLKGKMAVNIPRLVMAQPKSVQLIEMDMREGDPHFEVAKRNEKHKSRDKRRKPLRPSKEALEAYDYTDSEDDGKNLGEELLGKERSEKVSKFCSRLKNFICCCGLLKKKKGGHEKLAKNAKDGGDRRLCTSDDEESNPTKHNILSPQVADDDGKKDGKVEKDKDKKGKHAGGKEDGNQARRDNEQDAEGGNGTGLTKNHKKNKRRRKRELEERNVEGEKEDDDSLTICKLCMREQPLYFYQQEDIIKRLPERSLTKLLTLMKQDLQAKQSYLKYLKVSAKFCSPCECPRKKVHTYCQTAHIIKNQRIYCDKCNGQYNLFIKEERVCSSKFVALLVKYFLFTLLLIVVTTGFLMLDGYLKLLHAKENPEAAELSRENLEAQAQNNVLSMGFVPNFQSEGFDPFTTVSWMHLTHLAMIEVILIGKCVYSQLARAVQTRKKIIYIEVKNYSDKTTRNLSKRNLNTVVETFQKQKNYALFDKFWYQKRSAQYISIDYHGLTTDIYYQNVVNDNLPNQMNQLRMQRQTQIAAMAKRAQTSTSRSPIDSARNMVGALRSNTQTSDGQMSRTPSGTAVNKMDTNMTPAQKDGQGIEMKQLIFRGNTKKNELLMESPTLGGGTDHDGTPEKTNGPRENLPTSLQFVSNYKMKLDEQQNNEKGDQNQNNEDKHSKADSQEQQPTKSEIPLKINGNIAFDRRRVASVVETSAGGDMHQIKDLLRKYTPNATNGGFTILSEGIQSNKDQNLPRSSTSGNDSKVVSKNLLRQFDKDEAKATDHKEI